MTPDQGQFNATRREIVENYMWAGDKPDEETRKIQQGRTVRHLLLEDVTTAAMHHALQTGTGLDEFRVLAEGGVWVVNDLQGALTDWREGKPALNKQWNFWRHEGNPWHLIKNQKQPYMDRSSIEEAASAYLRLPYRAERLERTFVDVLVALEMYAFGEMMFTKYPVGLRWLPTRSPIQEKHILRRYLGGQVWNAAIFLGGAWLAGDALNGLVANVLIFVFLALVVLSTVLLPFAWRHQTKARSTVWKCLHGMFETYSELSSDGTISTRRLREVAVKAADVGVGWPGPLFAILDDNLARSGKL